MARKPNHDQVSLVMEYGVNLATRSLHLIGEVDDEFVTQGIRGLELLCAASLEPITIYLTSNGGDVEAGMGLYSAIETCPADVTIIVLGSAQSMGAMLLQAADHRVVARYATIMVHNPTLSMEAESHSFSQWSRWSENMRTLFATILAAKSGRSRGFWRNKLRADAIFTAEQAVQYGLADAILQDFPAIYTR